MIEYAMLKDKYTFEYLGSGFNAWVYKIDDFRVFKKFYERRKFEDSCIELMKLNSDTFVFPQELVYDNNIFIGYIMEYIDGNTLDKLSDDEDINNYLNEVKKHIYDVSIISLYGYYAFDFKPENIMYSSDKKIKIIDTDYYFKSNSKTIYKDNLSKYSIACLNPLIDIFNVNYNSDRLNHINSLLLDGKYSPYKYYKEVLESIKKESLSDINTFKEAREGLKLILK